MEHRLGRRHWRLPEEEALRRGDGDGDTFSAEGLRCCQGNRFQRRSKPSQDWECFVIDLAHYAAFVISQFRMRATTKDDGQRLRPDTMSAAAAAAAAFLGPQWATCRSRTRAAAAAAAANRFIGFFSFIASHPLEWQ